MCAQSHLADGPRRKLLILDVDGVLFQGHFIIALNRRRGFWAWLSTMADSACFNVGRMDLHTFLTRAYHRLRHMRWSVVWDTYRRMPLTPNAAESIRLLRAEGMRVVLITSGIPDAIVKDLAARLGADDGLGMQAEMVRGRLTGRVTGTLVRPEGKLEVAGELVEREGVAWDDVAVVGDDVNNLPLMRQAGMSIGFLPAYTVRREVDHLVDERDLAAIVPCVTGTRISPAAAPSRRLRQRPWYREILRKLVHMSAVAIALLAGRFPLSTSLLLLWATALYLVSEYCRVNGVPVPYVHRVGRRLIRRHERRDVAYGPLTLALGVFVALWCLPREIGLACILIVAVGDSLASVVGSRWGRVRWPHNRLKTLEGSLAFLVGAVTCASVYLPWDEAIVLGLVGTFLESLPLQDWDNFLTPVGAGVCGALMRML